MSLDEKIALLHAAGPIMASTIEELLEHASYGAVEEIIEGAAGETANYHLTVALLALHDSGHPNIPELLRNLATEYEEKRLPGFSFEKTGEVDGEGADIIIFPSQPKS